MSSIELEVVSIKLQELVSSPVELGRWMRSGLPVVATNHLITTGSFNLNFFWGKNSQNPGTKGSSLRSCLQESKPPRWVTKSSIHPTLLWTFVSDWTVSNSDSLRSLIGVENGRLWPKKKENPNLEVKLLKIRHVMSRPEFYQLGPRNCVFKATFLRVWFMWLPFHHKLPPYHSQTKTKDIFNTCLLGQFQLLQTFQHVLIGSI